jgi:hypothetical protein
MDRLWLSNTGFKGFLKISFLKSIGYSDIPKHKGVYVIVRESIDKPVFLDVSIGGHFKGKDPTVSISELEDNWVNSSIIYIGKAGGSGSGATLHSRLRQYIEFGKGKDIGHWGGKYIWQLKDSDNLLVAWKVLKEEPDDVETKLIEQFRKEYGKRPFANLTK